MLLPIPEEVLQAQARDRALDILLGSLGVSAAAISVSFAAYMFVSAPGRPAGGGIAPVASLSNPPSHGARAVAAVPAPDGGATGGAGSDIDFDPTGSIALPAEPQKSDGPAPATPAILSDYAVRDAFDGTALVEAHGTLRMVQAGATIDGAGQVLSIARRKGGWVVTTSGGLIVQRR